MEDAVRPDPIVVQQVLKRSHSLWSSYAAAITDARIPAECLQLRKLLGRVPAFPSSLLQTHQKPSTLQYDQSYSDLVISGKSTWRTSLGDCHLPSKTLRYELLCGFSKSISCSLTEHSQFLDWPGVQEENGLTVEGDGQNLKGNHLTILILAWAYILSARWVELQSSSSPRCPLGGIHYSILQAAHVVQNGVNGDDNEEVPIDAIDIEVDGKSKQAIRWWAAILAPGEGWHATIKLGDAIYRSPWSAHIVSPRILRLRTAKFGSVSNQHSEIPPSSDEALEYMRDHCELHGISSQCIPALAASLFIPQKGGFRSKPAVLPLPKPTPIPDSKLRHDSKLGPSHFKTFLQNEYRLLPYYMTLSCSRTRALRAVLAGSFFDPTIPCNLVSPWMQPVFETIDPAMMREDSTSLAVIMSRRQPSLAGLWLGAIVLGMEKTIVQEIRNGMCTVDLHAAVWTGTINSFINFNSHTPDIENHKEISRSDESRLLFIAGSETHVRLPVSPWHPFGATPLELADIEVRQHATCTGHCLQYVSWRWDTNNGLSSEDCGHDADAALDAWDTTAAEPDSAPIAEQTRVSLQSESLSEGATRTIFNWLRVDGYPPTEKAIFTHDWFDMGSSTDDSLSTAASDPQILEKSMINEWIDKVE